jgi:hypothetical protein
LASSLHDKSNLPPGAETTWISNPTKPMKRPQILLGFFLVVLAALSARDAGWAGESASRAEKGRIADLIRQLGSDDFNAREEASRRLLRIGLPAKQALLEGAKDDDLEIRRRCRDLLPAILDADRQVKLAALLADKEGKQKHDLPGWERYRKIAGTGEAARQFFVAMHKADTALLAEADKDPANAGKRCASLCQSAMHRQQLRRLQQIRVIDAKDVPPDSSLAEIALLLFIAGDARVTIPVEHRFNVCNLLYLNDVRTELRKTAASPFKKVVLAWMERQIEDDSSAGMLFTALSNNLDLKEGLDLAVKAIRAKKLKASGLAHAMVTIGKFGDKQHVPLLEPFLDDKTQIAGFGIGGAGGAGISGTTQVRDAALAMLVHLTKQSHKDYGFAVSKANNRYLMFHAHYLGFSSGAERDKAFAKWKAWKDARKKEEVRGRP